LTVGPQSARAGAVCYGRGGAEPTVTDAHLVLGHLPPYVLGGAFALDVDAARRAIATRIAEPMGLARDEAARGILAIADNHMTGAIRVVSVERGHDPRVVLVPFGRRRPAAWRRVSRPPLDQNRSGAARSGGDLGARAARPETENRVLAHLPRTAVRL